MSAHDLRVFDRVGITAILIQNYSHGREFPKVARFKAQRLYCALVLLSVWKMSGSADPSPVENEGAAKSGAKKMNAEALGYQSIWNVAKAYCIDRGRVQNLLARTSSFGSNVLQFVQVISFFLSTQIFKFFSSVSHSFI